MNEVLRTQIQTNLNVKETDELVEIWHQHNTDEWTAEAFEIIEGILVERLGQLPDLPVQMQVMQVLGRVETYLEAGNLDKALSECELAIQMAPDLAIAHNYRGLIYDEMGQLDQAIASYQAALRLDPEMKYAWNNMKVIEGCLEDEFLQSVAKQHLDQALAFAYSDEPEKALEACELARKTLPAIALANNYLGLILQELEQFEAAIETYLEAIRLNPQFYAARENLCSARKSLEAEQYRKAAVDGADEAQGEYEEFPDLNDYPDAEMAENDDIVPGWIYSDERAFVLVGWPGHRTRQGRSGYDPLEMDFESSHMQGVIIRALFTGKFRTHNPFYLLLMAFMGIWACSPLLLFIKVEWSTVIAVIPYSLYGGVGIAFLINVFVSMWKKKPGGMCDDGSTFF